MSRPARIALIGAGRVARDWVLVLEQARDFELFAVCDPALAARQRAAALALAPTYADLDALLDAHEIDAALVASPPDTHASLAVRLLERGCDVLCEKPLATTTTDAERMVATAERTGRVLMMATKFRFVDDVLHAHDLVTNGTLGEVVFYENTFCSHVPMVGRWNANPAVAGGGVLIDNGTHSVDLARWLAGPITRVTAAFGPQLQPLDVEDSALLLLETESGALGRIDLSWSITRPTPWIVEIAGTRGTAQVGWNGSRFRTDGDWIEFGAGYDKRRAFATQLAHFGAVRRGECDACVTALDMLASVSVVEAAYRAARQGEWIDVTVAVPTR